MIHPFDLGPINAGALLAATIFLTVTVIVSLRRVHRGDAVPLVALGTALLLPLVFTAWASTWQHDAAMEWAMNAEPVTHRQTFMAAMLTRTVGTQLYGGVVTATGGLTMLVGSLILTVRGERPRWMFGGLAAAIGVILVSVAAVGMSTYPALVTATRVGTYATVAAVSVAALVSAHRRGPGVQLATLVAVVLPLVVVAADLATLGSIATIRITEVAQAPVAEKQALMAATMTTLDTIQGSAWIGLFLAAGLGFLGPLVAWRRERTHATATVLALAAIVAVAALGLSWTMHWTLPLRW